MRLLIVGILITAFAGSQSDLSAINSPQRGTAAISEAGARLAGRTDAAALSEWTRIVDEMYLSHDARLKETVEHLRSLKLYDNESWIQLINLGYAYIGDTEGRNNFAAEIARVRPDSEEAVRLAVEKWHQDHQPQDPTRDGLVKWRLKEIAFLKGLFRQKPNSEAARAQYVNAALLMESALSTQDALEVSELARAGHMRFLYSPNFALAELYLHHHTHLDLVPALLDAEIKAARHPPSGGPPQTPGEDIRNQILTEILAHRDLVEYWLAKRDLPNARAVMKELEADITRLASNAGGRAERITVVKSMERQRQALAHRVGMEAKPIELAGEPDPAQSRRDRLTAFYGTDLTGRRWTMADLDGKVTLINTWSTWCGPCRQELPYIQKLYDSFRNRKDRMVITISLDENDQLARNFIRKYGYTFPVIRSTELAAHINFAIDVPQNRLIDARRRIVAQAIEFSGNSFPSTITNLMDRMQ